MPDERVPIWSTAEEVEIINRVVVAARREPFGVLSRSGLEGAVARPLNAWLYEDERDVIALGVRLLEAVGQGHLFVQGNKRTALFAALEFIERNGGVFRASDGEELGRLAEAVCLRQADPMLLVGMLRERVRYR